MIGKSKKKEGKKKGNISLQESFFICFPSNQTPTTSPKKKRKKNNGV